MVSLVRDPQTVLANLVENKSGQVLTKVPCKIQVPARFATVGLGQIGIDVFTYGCFPIILETGEYSVCNVNALVSLNPYKVLTINIDDVDYNEFHFEAGQVVINTTDLVKKDTLLYFVFDEFIFKGKVPWYVEYEDLGKLFDTSQLHAGSNIGQRLEVIELIASMISRPKNDRSKYIRLSATKYADLSIDKVSYVPLNSVFYSVNTTINKLTGNYFSDGVTSALVTSTHEVQKIESILRM